jgi:hypothetical protein
LGSGVEGSNIGASSVESLGILIGVDIDNHDGTASSVGEAGADGIKGGG